MSGTSPGSRKNRITKKKEKKKRKRKGGTKMRMGERKERYRKKERKEYGKSTRDKLKNFITTKGGTI